MSKRMDRISRREQIAEEALKLAARGISAITMDNVSKACGIVPSALYRHYKNKNEIIHGLKEIIRKKLIENAQLAASEESSPLAALKNLARRHAELICDHPGIPRFLFSEASLDKDSLRRKGLQSIINEYRAAAAVIAEKGQQIGEIRTDISAVDVVFMLLGTVVPPSFLFHITSGEFDPREQVERNLRLFEDAVRSGTED
ncbi:TetR/AcrR family transcriptional regulator [Maridesulfovibrio zosterae]|uniref:TetR/AcrR family transcriptional regulator n=1 Tax=Maridesulfovibrio zosterae TaxID=82171 RepID=UPI0003FF108E|nr:TetR/AcrR family transcriptional regulator [Maridesulfovibrio zosterae]